MTAGTQRSRGLDFVLHVASPLGLDGSGDLVGPARDGALRVLGAATAAGCDGSCSRSAANAASPSSYRDEGITDETLWTDPETPGLQAYRHRRRWPSVRPGSSWKPPTVRRL